MLIAKHNLFWKRKCLKQASYIRYLIVTISKIVKISIKASSDSFYREFFENSKGLGNSFQATLFIELSETNFSFLMLHDTGHQILLPDCVYFPSYSVKSISCFKLRHSIRRPGDIWISEKLKFYFPDQKELLKRNENFFFLI